MGREKYQTKNKHQQVEQKLVSMLHAGEGLSKQEAIAKGIEDKVIHSYKTYHNYKTHLNHFADYLDREHPDVTKMSKGKKYVAEYLQSRFDYRDKDGKPLSQWTIKSERQALNKYFGIKPGDKEFFVTGTCNREDIKRSRMENNTNSKHFSEANNRELVNFAKATGCRRNVLEHIKGRDLCSKDQLIKEANALEEKGGDNLVGLSTKEQKHYNVLTDALRTFPDEKYYIHHVGDKNGRERYSPIIGKHAQDVIDRMQATPPDKRVWSNVPAHMDVHKYRGMYATELYMMYARPIDQIPFDKINKGSGRRYQSEVYCCRKDEKGKKLDKAAMAKVSKALGHSRLEIVANNYIRGL